MANKKDRVTTVSPVWDLCLALRNNGRSRSVWAAAGSTDPVQHRLVSGKGTERGRKASLRRRDGGDRIRLDQSLSPYRLDHASHTIMRSLACLL
jgi:hypothetical protein